MSQFDQPMQSPFPSLETDLLSCSGCSTAATYKKAAKSQDPSRLILDFSLKLLFFDPDGFDGDRGAGFAGGGGFEVADLVGDVHAFNDFPEHGVLSGQVRGIDDIDEEL